MTKKEYRLRDRRRQMERKIIEFLLEKKSKRWIKKTLKTSYRRMRRIVELARGYGYLDGSRSLPAFPEPLFPDPVDGRGFKQSDIDRALLEQISWIKDRLHIGWQPITVFEELPVKTTRSSFYRFLHRHDLYKVGRKHRRVIPEIVHQPGEALILDWGKLRDVIDDKTGKKKTLYAFVGVLGFSRYMMVRLVWSNDVATTLKAIEGMFVEIGGVPKKITSDNPKCFAIEASRFEPLLNPAFERFAAHYGAIIECLPPASPEKKGKVERMIPFTRRLNQAHGDSWQGKEESQEYLNGKIVLANQRKHGTTLQRPVDQFNNIEKSCLRSLPALAYEIEEISEGVIRRDGHVRFANKYYSVEEKYIGETVSILANSTRVSLYHHGKLIEVHDRLTDKYRSKQTKLQHLKPWEQAMQDNSMYRTRARKIGADVERLVCILLEQGQGFIDTRKIWGILSLDKAHSNENINRACRDAIDLGSYSYRTVKSILNLIPVSASVDDKTTTQSNKAHKFVRPLIEYQLPLLQ